MKMISLLTISISLKLYFLSHRLIFRDVENGKKDAGGQMKRRKSRVTDDRGRANLTSFSAEELCFAALPSWEEVTAL